MVYKTEEEIYTTWSLKTQKIQMCIFENILQVAQIWLYLRSLFSLNTVSSVQRHGRSQSIQ